MFDVADYLKQMFPIREEREMGLKYFSYCLSGRMDVKAFLVITDERAGNNGKTTFLTFLKHLLGNYYINGRTHTLKSTIVGDRNSHGANELELNGRRVCGGDEWSCNDTIDTTWINERVSGQSFEYEVRGCGAKKMSPVLWMCIFSNSARLSSRPVAARSIA